MKSGRRFSITSFKAHVAHWFTGPSALAFLPALCLGSFWIWGETALIIVSLGIPLLILLVNPEALGKQAEILAKGRGLVPKADFEQALEGVHAKTLREGHQSAVFLLEIAEYPKLVQCYGPAAAENVARQIGERLHGVLRESDLVTQVNDCRFGVCLAPVQHLDLEVCLQLAGRMQTSIEEPISIDGTVIYTSAAIGFCQTSRAPKANGHAWLEGAEMALGDACRRGPTAIRAFSNEMRKIAAARISMRDGARDALDGGEIQPWFQPQISTDTGRVTGFEALARWIHPEKGLIAPNEFLPVFEDMGLLDRLGEVSMFHALNALKAWDAAGVHVPTVGLNFSGPELNNPKLLERVQWELDRFDVAPERICVEVLETVVSSAPGDTVARNVRALGDLGCQIDLDDFGTGNASIAAIRRFSVARIKIDRSFVTKADRDPDQRRMIAAILTMAERLGVETLAEGVETVGEHALLSQLGCDHVQGFGIGRPMAFDKTIEWIHRHEAKLKDPPTLPNRKAPGGST